jgi:hypothetical protein
MAVFEPNQPITTEQPVLVVDASLQPGRYRLRLVVINSDGQESLPSEQIITIREPQNPPPRQPLGVQNSPWWFRWRR